MLNPLRVHHQPLQALLRRAMSVPIPTDQSHPEIFLPVISPAEAGGAEMHSTHFTTGIRYADPADPALPS